MTKKLEDLFWDVAVVILFGLPIMICLYGLFTNAPLKEINIYLYGSLVLSFVWVCCGMIVSELVFMFKK